MSLAANGHDESTMATSPDVITDKISPRGMLFCVAAFAVTFEHGSYLVSLLASLLGALVLFVMAFPVLVTLGASGPSIHEQQLRGDPPFNGRRNPPQFDKWDA